MAAKDYLELQRQRVEDAIGRLLPDEGTRPAILSEAIRYSVLTGGKRLRPFLVYQGRNVQSTEWCLPFSVLHSPQGALSLGHCSD